MLVILFKDGESEEYGSLDATDVHTARWTTANELGPSRLQVNKDNKLVGEFLTSELLGYTYQTDLDAKETADG